MSATTDPYIVGQILTLAIPLGSFIVGCIWLFFQRRNSR